MITVNGTIVSRSKDGKKAQLLVKTGAYKGTYHGVFERSAGSRRTQFSLWFTIPNKVADQIGIVTKEVFE